MNRRTTIMLTGIIAVLGPALLPIRIVAQQETLKQQLAGPWMPVSVEITTSNGTKLQRYGANPKGPYYLGC